MPKKVKLRQVGDSLVVTIPKAIVESLNWNKSDEIEILVTGMRSLQLTKS